MTFNFFKAMFVDDVFPPEIAPVLRALWVKVHGDWDGAHKIVQDVSDCLGACVHVYLHRKEGDLTNAVYWYSRADRKFSAFLLEREWEEIVKTPLASSA